MLEEPATAEHKESSPPGQASIIVWTWCRDSCDSQLRSRGRYSTCFLWSRRRPCPGLQGRLEPRWRALLRHIVVGMLCWSIWKAIRWMPAVGCSLVSKMHQWLPQHREQSLPPKYTARLCQVRHDPGGGFGLQQAHHHWQAWMLLVFELRSRGADGPGGRQGYMRPLLPQMSRFGYVGVRWCRPCMLGASSQGMGQLWHGSRKKLCHLRRSDRKPGFVGASDGCRFGHAGYSR